MLVSRACKCSPNRWPIRAAAFQIRGCSTAFDSKDEVSCDVSPIPDHVKTTRMNVSSNYDKRRLFGKVGLASNVDPAIAWPTKEELHVMKQFDAQFEPSIQDLLSTVRKEEEESSRAMRERQEKVAKAMAEMPKLIAQYHAKNAQKVGDVSKIGKKRQAVLDEAREHFGYELSPRDPRFLEFMERKKEEEKRLKKKLRKQKRVERAMLSLIGRNPFSGVSSSSKGNA